MAPGSPDPENIALNIRLPRVLRAKLDKYVSLHPKAADGEDNSASKVLRELVKQKVFHIQLSDEEMESIRIETEKARIKNKKK